MTYFKKWENTVKICWDFRFGKEWRWMERTNIREYDSITELSEMVSLDFFFFILSCSSRSIHLLNKYNCVENLKLSQNNTKVVK